MEQLKALPESDWRIRPCVFSLARRLKWVVKEGRDAARLALSSELEFTQKRYLAIRGERGFPLNIDNYLGTTLTRESKLGLRSAVVEILQYSQPLSEETIRRYMRRYPADRIAELYARYRWQDLCLPPADYTGVYIPTPRADAKPIEPSSDPDIAELLHVVIARYAGLPWSKVTRPDPGFVGIYIPIPKG